PFGYATLFGLGLLVRTWTDGPAAVLVAAITYLIARFGLRASMLRWPWDLSAAAGVAAEMGPSNQPGSADPRLGWPYDRLAPKFPERLLSVPTHHGLL